MLVNQLKSPTPNEWLSYAETHLDELLSDHASCELKAAGTALKLMFRLREHPDCCVQLSRLAREELVHYEQVCRLMRARGIAHQSVPPSDYASALRCVIRTPKHEHLIDTLLVCAVIEARSCERFQALVPRLDGELSDFYGRLYQSEARHADGYLTMLEQLYPDQDVTDRLAVFLELDANAVVANTTTFAFHSGVPV